MNPHECLCYHKTSKLVFIENNKYIDNVWKILKANMH